MLELSDVVRAGYLDTGYGPIVCGVGGRESPLKEPSEP